MIENQIPNLEAMGQAIISHISTGQHLKEVGQISQSIFDHLKNIKCIYLICKNIPFNSLITLNINIKRLEEGYRSQLKLIMCRIYGVGSS